MPNVANKTLTPARLTPLHLAAMRGDMVTARQWIERSNEIDPVTIKGATPLHLAVMQGHSEMVALLIAHGANTSLLEATLIP